MNKTVETLPAIMEPSPEQLPPLPDIARWMVRLELAHLALNQVPSMTNEGWGSNGQTAWMLAGKAKTPDEWSENPWFEEVIMFRLDTFLPERSNNGHRLKSIANVLQPTGSIENQSNRAQVIERHAGRVALERLGVLTQEEGELQLDQTAVAAYAYFRADIHNPLDRALYAHDTELKELCKGLVPKPRTAELDYGEEKHTVTRYALSAHLDDKQLSQRSFTSSQDMWWSELQHDLELVDANAAARPSDN